MKTSIINKIAFAILCTFALFLSTLVAQNDTMYIMKNGVVVGQYDVNTEIDSIIFYRPNQYGTTFTDARDGNVYNYVAIGNHVWMAENLKYLPSVTDGGIGSNTTPYYYVYDYSGTNVAEAKETDNYTTYGVLYNWAAAMGGSTSSSSNPSGIQGVCPAGWHLPSDAEWTELTDYLGGLSVAGCKLKESGTNHWNSPNDGATNETGFKALPGGYKDFDGSFISIHSSGAWWCATEYDTDNAWFRGIEYNQCILGITSFSKNVGYSVRCVKD